jgi:CheY-like chemotaxis protein
LPLGDEIYLGDPGRLAQIISTLMAQAINAAAAQGALTLAASVSAPSPGRIRRLCVTVSTNAPRAAPSPAAEAKAAPRAAGHHPGPGSQELSRALARALVKLQGGEISLEASPGAPLAFWVPLTLATADIGVIAPKSAKGALGLLRILVAEDHPANRMIIKTLLDPFDITLTFAVDGRAAVDLYAEESFDLVLMDSHMTVMDGLAAVMEIRRLELRASRPRTPIAIVSADVGPEHRSAVRRAGADAFISKPITAERLTAAIELLTGLSAS